MKKVLILSASTGEGHNSAAKSLEDAYRETGYATQRVDIFKETGYVIDKLVSDGYRIVANKMPLLYGIMYDTADRKSINNRFLNSIFYFVRMKILDIINDFEPDLIVGTHPFSVGIVGNLKRKGKVKASFISVVTDFKAHWAYVDKGVDAYITGSQYTKDSLTEKDVPSDKVYTYGIPIKKEFMPCKSPESDDEVERDGNCDAENQASKDRAFDDLNCNSALEKEMEEYYKAFKDMESFRDEENSATREIVEYGFDSTLNWNENGGRFKVLVMGGSMGSGDIADVAHYLTEDSDNYEITVVCGNNKSLKEMLDKRYAKSIANGTLIVYGFTDKIPSLMDECDVIVTKPGGLTTSESIAKNIPMIVPFAIPGQESENTEFLVDQGIAIHVKEIKELRNSLESLLENKQAYLDMKKKMQSISENYSLQKIVDLSTMLIDKNTLH